MQAILTSSNTYLVEPDFRNFWPVFGFTWQVIITFWRQIDVIKYFLHVFNDAYFRFDDLSIDITENVGHFD